MLWGRGHWLELNKQKSDYSVLSLFSLCQTQGWGGGARTRMRASDGEAQRVSLETRVGPYVCACPGAALSEDSLRKRTQASDAQRRAVGEEMDPDLFLRKVSTLQVGMELRVHLG